MPGGGGDRAGMSDCGGGDRAGTPGGGGDRAGTPDCGGGDRANGNVAIDIPDDLNGQAGDVELSVESFGQVNRGPARVSVSVQRNARAGDGPQVGDEANAEQPVVENARDRAAAVAARNRANRNG
eukprot:2156_1